MATTKLSGLLRDSAAWIVCEVGFPLVGAELWVRQQAAEVRHTIGWIRFGVALAAAGRRSK